MRTIVGAGNLRNRLSLINATISHGLFALVAMVVLGHVLTVPVAAKIVTSTSPIQQTELAQSDVKERGAFSDRGMTTGRGAAEPTTVRRQIGVFDRTWAVVLQWQHRINKSLTDAVRGFKTKDPLTASALLILLSFTYGVLHAVGPGHGKFVISSYVLANERTVRRGIGLAFLSALFQAVSAITIVSVMAVILNRTGLEIRATEAWITTLSWALVAAIGGLLLYRQAQNIRQATTSTGPTPHPDPNHVHSKSCGCGHGHMPAPGDLDGAWSWRRALPLALAVGIRPCTGAVLVLIFAWTQGLFWAGVLATFAMAIGTAITVSCLAALAVGSRELATRFAGPSSPWATRIQTAAGVIGATLLLAFGLTFFIASLGPQSPF